MNDFGATAGGIGAITMGLVLLMYQIGRWRGGDPTPQIHFWAGVALAALLFLGGGLLGVMGGAAAALGDGVGTYALEGATGAVARAGSHPPVTGGERVAVGGAVVGLALLAFYMGLIKSGRADLREPVMRGAAVGVFLGGAAGLIGMALGLIRTSGNTIGTVLLGVI